MESRASYLLIGSFVLLVVAGLFGFIVWLTGAEINRQVDRYDIFFEGSVAGLGVGGDVRYRGIKVGNVVSINVDPDDPERVRALVEIGTGVPIREGDQASLKMQGITGVSYVNIEGAGPQSPVLVAGEGDKYPVIASKASSIDQLLSDAPDMLESATELLNRINNVFDEDNRAAISGILNDVHAITTSLAGRSGHIGRMAESFDRLSGQLVTVSTTIDQTASSINTLAMEVTTTVQRLNQTLGEADDVIEGDLTAMITELRGTAREISALASSANAMIEENRAPIQKFTGEGLNQLSTFLNEASILVTSMSRLTDRLDMEGARFLMGPQESEYQVREQ